MGHMLLYKYKDFDYGHQILTDNTIKISNPYYLNDGYEMIPNPGIQREEALELILHGSWNQTFKDEAYQEHGVIFSDEMKFRSYVFRNLKSLRMKLEQGNRDLQNRILASAKHISKGTGIYSLTKDSASPLMWSHYADGYRGLCIGFDLDEFGLDFTSIDVDYRAERPRLNYQVIESTEQTRAFTYKLLSTKGEEWRYESEIRLLFNLQEGDIGREWILSTIPKASIREVYITPKIRSENLADLLVTLRNPEYEQVTTCIVHHDYEDGSFNLHSVRTNLDDIQYEISRLNAE